MAGAVSELSFLSKTPLPTQPAAADPNEGQSSIADVESDSGGAYMEEISEAGDLDEDETC